MNDSIIIPRDVQNPAVEWAGMAAIIAPEPWMQSALCAQSDPEAFFPEKGGSTKQAKKICESCDVADQCLDYALRTQERYGIWGGLSERDRRKFTREVAPLSKLTADKERKLREMSAQSFTNVLIGEALSLSAITVGRYRRQLGLPPSPSGRRPRGDVA